MSNKDIWNEYMAARSAPTETTGDSTAAVAAWAHSVLEQGRGEAVLSCLQEKYAEKIEKWNKSYDWMFKNDWLRVYVNSPKVDGFEILLLIAMCELGDKQALRLLVILSPMSPLSETLQIAVEHMDETVIQALSDGIDYQLPEAAMTTHVVIEKLAKTQLDHPLLPLVRKLRERYEINIESMYLDFPMEYRVRFKDNEKKTWT